MRFRRRDESRPRGRSRGTTLLGGVRDPACSLGSRPVLLPRRSAGAFFRRLRGDLHPAHAPGLPPSPVAPGCVRRYSSHPRLSLRPVYGARRGRPTGLPRAGAGGAVTRMATRARPSPARPSGGLPAGSWAQPMGGRPAPVGAGRTGGMPRCRGLGSIYRSQHDSRARSHEVKGSRPWWRRRPPGDHNGGRASQCHTSCRRCHDGLAEEGTEETTGRRTSPRGAPLRRPVRRRRRRKEDGPGEEEVQGGGRPGEAAAKKAAADRRRQPRRRHGREEGDHRQEDRGQGDRAQEGREEVRAGEATGTARAASDKATEQVGAGAKSAGTGAKKAATAAQGAAAAAQRQEPTRW